MTLCMVSDDVVFGVCEVATVIRKRAGERVWLGEIECTVGEFLTNHSTLRHWEVSLPSYYTSSHCCLTTSAQETYSADESSPTLNKRERDSECVLRTW